MLNRARTKAASATISASEIWIARAGIAWQRGRAIVRDAHRANCLTGVQRRFDGTSIYSAQDVEDVVAYLLTLEEH